MRTPKTLKILLSSVISSESYVFCFDNIPELTRYVTLHSTSKVYKSRYINTYLYIWGKLVTLQFNYFYHRALETPQNATFYVPISMKYLQNSKMRSNVDFI